MLYEVYVVTLSLLEPTSKRVLEIARIVWNEYQVLLYFFDLSALLDR